MKLTIDERFHFVPSTDDRIKPIQMLAQLFSIIDAYDGIPVGIDNSYVSADRTVKTSDAQAGFALRQYLETAIHANLQGQLIEQFRLHSAPINKLEPHLYSRLVNMYALPQEAKLQRALSSLSGRSLFDVRGWYNFHRLWDSEVLRLKEIDEGIIFQKHRMWLSHNYTNYRLLMDNDPAFVSLMTDMVQQHVNESFRVGTVNDRAALTDIFKLMKFNKNVITFASDIAEKVMAADGMRALKQVSILMQMCRWIQATVNISLTNQSAPTIVGLMAIKLLTPSTIWSARARTMIHNYLARWLLASMPAFLDDKSGVTVDQFDFGEDMLARMLSNAAWWSADVDLATLRDFFLSWSDRGTPAVFPLSSVNGETVNPVIKNEHLSTSLFHQDYVSLSATEKAYVLKQGQMEFAQLRAFEKVVKIIEKQSQQVRRWRRLKSEFVEPISNILVEMVNRSESLREMMFGFSTAHRAMSIHTLTGSSKEGLIENRNTWVAFDPVDFASIIFKVDTTSLMNLTFDNSFYQKSLSIHDFLSDVGDALLVAKKYMASPIFKRSEVITQALLYVPAHPIRDFVKTELLERKKIVPYERFIARNHMSAKLSAAEAFFASIPTNLLGFVPSFIYTNGFFHNTPLVVDPKFRILQTVAPVKPALTLTIQELESLMLKMRLKDTLDKAKGPVRFAIPVGIKASVPSTTPFVPFKLSENTHISLSDIMVGYRDADEEVRHATDEFAWLMPLEYAVERTPWQDVEPAYPLTTMIHDVETWSELQFDVKLDYMHVSPSSH
jgi:hypothetical protein